MKRLLPVAALLACATLAGCGSATVSGPPPLWTPPTVKTVKQTPADCRVSNSKIAGTDDPEKIGEVQSYKSIELGCTASEIKLGSAAAQKRWASR